MSAETDGRRDKNILTSLNHALKVLDLLSIRSDLGVTEIAGIVGYDKSSVYKMLYTFERRGYVIKGPKARYRLSEKLSSHGSAAESRQNITDMAAPFMRRLRDECGETVYLGVLNTNGRIIFMHKEDGYSSDSIITRTGYEIDAYTNATGKILLANLDAPLRESLLKMIHFRAHTPLSITSPAALVEELTTLQGAAWAEQYDENYVGHSDIASPIYERGGRCIAALSITSPTAVLRKNRDRFRPLLIQAAEGISRKMGHRIYL